MYASKYTHIHKCPINDPTKNDGIRAWVMGLYFLSIFRVSI